MLVHIVLRKQLLRYVKSKILLFTGNMFLFKLTLIVISYVKRWGILNEFQSIEFTKTITVLASRFKFICRASSELPQQLKPLCVK